MKMNQNFGQGPPTVKETAAEKAKKEAESKPAPVEKVPVMPVIGI